MNNEQEKNRAVRTNSLLIVHCSRLWRDSLSAALLLALCSLLFIPHNLNAQTLGIRANYQASITTDEEGKNLSMPSFVLSEPVMNEIYIINRRKVIIYTSDLFPLYALGKSEGIESPRGLTLDDKGNLYVVQSATGTSPIDRISVFNACLKWERDIVLEGFEGSDTFVPYSLAIDKKRNIYVSAIYFPGVLVLNNQGRIKDIISPVDEGKKANIANVTIDETGRIYLVSEEMGRIYVYDEDRQFLFKFGEKGGSTGKLSRAKAAAVDNRKERIYVVDYMRHTINAYNLKGEYLFEFGGLGWGPGWFQTPVDITVDSSGRVMIADLFNHRIQVFKPR